MQTIAIKANLTFDLKSHRQSYDQEMCLELNMNRRYLQFTIKRQIECAISWKPYCFWFAFWHLRKGCVSFATGVRERCLRVCLSSWQSKTVITVSIWSPNEMSKEAQALRAAPASLAKSLSLSQESSINFEGMHPHTAAAAATKWYNGARRGNATGVKWLGLAEPQKRERDAHPQHTHTLCPQLNY